MLRRERLFYVLLALGTLALGFGILLYQGPAQVFIRGTMGDVLAVAFLYAVLSLALWPSWPWRLFITLGIAFGLEGLQWLQVVPSDAPQFVRVILGATFDPLDLAAYSLGALPVVILEFVRHRRKA